ncbi:MAG: PAS domain-containing sensor histidine kinase [Thermodesulfovibrio sp.]|nr:PAS domain-containing sensor histidine kinase [Thermodesulfovibrio sp.]
MNRRLRILLIEDNPGDADLIEDMLTRADVRFELQCARRLSAGIELIKAGGADVILADLGLPDSQGLGTLVKLIDAGLDAPVIVLTGLADEAVGTEAVKAGAQDYLIKGQIDRNLLVRSINYAIERKKTQAALRESEDQYKALFNNSIDAVLLTRPDGSIISANPEACRMLESSEEEICRLSRNEVVDIDDPRLVPALEERASTGRFKGELLLRRRDGSKFPGEVSSALFTDIKGNVMTSMIVRDITERKNLETQLRHAQKMEAVGTLAGGIAHDFNNILNVIMGYGSMVRDALVADSLLRSQMDEVLAAAERAANLTGRLLVFSRKQIVDIKPVNINEIIVGFQKMLDRIIRENIAFALQIADRSLMVMADVGQIEQVLMNLVTNARDAMPLGGRLTIGTGLAELDDDYIATYGYGKPGRYVLVTVADTGCGIDGETQKKIFEPFFTTKGIGEGTGLGLAISYGIVKQHGGFIKVYSELGKGTLFKIYLPCIENTTESDMKNEALVAVAGGSETILVAEDDAAARKLMTIILESFGYRVITTGDGEEAIAAFLENRATIQLVILDMIMPKKNGQEVSEVIREESPGTKILFSSGYLSDMVNTRELTESGFEFVHKPFSPKDLLRKVRDILDR